MDCHLRSLKYAKQYYHRSRKSKYHVGVNQFLNNKKRFPNIIATWLMNTTLLFKDSFKGKYISSYIAPRLQMVARFQLFYSQIVTRQQLDSSQTVPRQQLDSSQIVARQKLDSSQIVARQQLDTSQIVAREQLDSS